MTKRRCQVDDFANFTLVGDIQISPDGKRAVFSRQTTSIQEDSYEVQLMYADLTTRYVKPLTTAGKSNHAAVWSPDGSQIAFISNRAFGKQLWVIPSTGGEAVRITAFRHGISQLRWSSDGQSVYALVPASKNAQIEVFPAEMTTSEAKEMIEKENKNWADTPKRYDELYYKRDGAGLSQLRYAQLVRIDCASGLHTQLTHGDQDIRTFAVAPDGLSLYFTKGRNREFEWWYADLYRYDMISGETSLVSEQFIFHELQFSPDGSALAALVYDDAFNIYQSATHLKLYVFSSNGEVRAHLTESFPDDLTNSNLSDLRADTGDRSLTWSSDGRHIYVLSTREGRGEIVRFHLDGSTPQGEIVAGGTRDIYAFGLANTTLVFAYATAVNPSRMVCYALHREPTYPGRAARTPEGRMDEVTPSADFLETEQTIYAPNDTWLETVEVSEPEPFWYRSANDWWVQGWVMRPAGFQAGKTYPVILEIHGGPQLNYGYAMFHEMQWFAANGYAIVYTNPRGGKSYGQTFVNAVRHHYGEQDAADVINGLDAALERFDFLDKKRVAVTGGSYGGFMTNWLVGHTNRFFAAVSQRSISNWVSFYGCSDIGPLFVESQLVENAKNNLTKLWEMSPLKYAQYVATPLLLLHSENDLRCPMEQAEQFYTWLRSQGKETQLVRIPNASHGLSRNGKPSLRIKRLEAILDYIDEHLPNE
ncbi:S9 family peptidase [Alicyclobacillus suci]|uniref:S9 family peptidase n=1 Tax=Alicyclobacillus suci TaxID=2816080 RepID=UPI001A8C00D8|nr:S9 family peptidase [Alicyclobacillus suci]